MKRLRWLLAVVPMLLLLTISASADSVTDTISIYVGYYGWSEDEYMEKVTYHWTELDDLYGGVLDTHQEIYSYYSGSRTYLVAARGFYIRDLLYYAGIDVGSVARIDFFTKDHNNGAYRSFTAYSLLEMPRYYFPNLAANEETGVIYPYDGDDIWNGATTVEAMLALEDFTEWDVSGTEFEQLYDPDMMNANARFHLFFGQKDPSEASTSSAAKYCYKLLITFSGTPVLTTEESNLDMKIGSGRKLEIDVDAEDGLLNDYVHGHITWSSSDPGVVSVAEDGTITVHSAGDAVITASFGNSSVSVNVHAEEGEESTSGSGIGGAGTPDETDGTPGGNTAQLPPAEGGETEQVSGRQVLTVSAQALAGTRSGNADAEDHSGGYMDEDTEQLVLTAPDRTSPALLTAAVLLLAFLLGGAYQVIRFKRLLRGTRK
ncbi:MAG: hypothetical protein ACI3XJ_11445 [Oscillospiraceae bacterium]